jgi:hypothetical protein
MVKLRKSFAIGERFKCLEKVLRKHRKPKFRQNRLHRIIASRLLVAVELKQGAFKPAYLGQLSAYLRILDSEVKKPFENPSIGIVLCKEADKTFVEFLIQGYDNPMGVATYKSAEDVRKVLPSEEDLRKAMEEG